MRKVARLHDVALHVRHGDDTMPTRDLTSVTHRLSILVQETLQRQKLLNNLRTYILNYTNFGSKFDSLPVIDHDFLAALDEMLPVGSDPRRPLPNAVHGAV